MGHADISMTSKVYAHLLDGDLRVRDEHHAVHHKESRARATAVTINDVEKTVQDLLVELVGLSGFTPEQLREIAANAAISREQQ